MGQNVCEQVDGLLQVVFGNGNPRRSSSYPIRCISAARVSGLGFRISAGSAISG